MSANALPVRVHPKGFGNKSVRCRPTRCCRWKCVVKTSVECGRRYFDVGRRVGRHIVGLQNQCKVNAEVLTAFIGPNSLIFHKVNNII